MIGPIIKINSIQSNPIQSNRIGFIVSVRRDSHTIGYDWVWSMLNRAFWNHAKCKIYHTQIAEKRWKCGMGTQFNWPTNYMILFVAIFEFVFWGTFEQIKYINIISLIVLPMHSTKKKPGLIIFDIPKRLRLMKERRMDAALNAFQSICLCQQWYEYTRTQTHILLPIYNSKFIYYI